MQLFFITILFCIFPIFAQNTQQLPRVAVYMAGNEPPNIRGVHNVVGGELVNVISRGNRYIAIDRTETIQNQLEREHDFQRSGAVSDDQIRALGQQFGADYLCVAEISALQGGAYHLNIRLIDVVTAEIKNSVTTTSPFRNATQMRTVAQEAALELIAVRNDSLIYLTGFERAADDRSVRVIIPEIEKLLSDNGYRIAANERDAAHTISVEARACDATFDGHFHYARACVRVALRNNTNNSETVIVGMSGTDSPKRGGVNRETAARDAFRAVLPELTNRVRTHIAANR